MLTGCCRSPRHAPDHTVRPFYQNGPELLQLDSVQRCELRVVGEKPPHQTDAGTFAVVRVPVYENAQVLGADGKPFGSTNTSTKPPPPADSNDMNEKLNVSSSIVEWRVMLVASFGCQYHRNSSTSLCRRKCSTPGFLWPLYLASNPLLCCHSQRLWTMVVAPCMCWTSLPCTAISRG